MTSVKESIETKNVFNEKIIIGVFIAAIVYFIITSPIMTTFGYWLLSVIGVVFVGFFKLMSFNKSNKINYWYTIISIITMFVAYYYATSTTMSTARHALIFATVLHVIDIIYSIYEYWMTKNLSGSLTLVIGSVVSNILLITSNSYILSS